MKTLIRAGKRPEEVLRPEAALQRGNNGVFGANVGNLIFSQAVYRTLNTPFAEIVPDGFTTERHGVGATHVARINDEFDHFVLPLANAFRQDFVPVLNRLSAVIERLDIPVTVVGVGAQLPRRLGAHVEGVPDSLQEPVSRFMRAVLNRSSKVGVRGEFTRQYLELIGFGGEHVEVIGCPSLLEHDQYKVEKGVGGLDSDSRIAFNAVPHLELMGNVFSDHVQRFPRLRYVQQEYRELALLMWGKSLPGEVARAFPTDINHAEYSRDRIRFFLDPESWRRYLATCDFSFGSRIHGNIAALTAGTPAVVISHDSRTKELAEYHQIPFREMPGAAGDVRAEELYDWADFSAFHSVQAENLSRFKSFLELHRLPHVHTPGNQNPDYAKLIEQTDFGGPVRSLASEDSRIIASRLNWLWQGDEADQARVVGAYVPPFVPNSDISNRPGLPSSLKETRDRLAATQREIDSLAKTVDTLQHEIQELRHWSTRPFALVPEGSWVRRASRRIRKLFRRRPS